MALEIEAKIKVADHQRVRAALPQHGTQVAPRCLETNRIFDGEMNLLARGCGLRVRQISDERGQIVGGSLTYKGPIEPGPLKVRPEIETPVADPRAAAEILEALGFTPRLTFQKYRETWAVGACVVELDEVPHLGCFIEIEGPSAEEVHEVRHRIGLAGEPLIQQSYISLLVEHCRSHGLPTDLIAFP